MTDDGRRPPGAGLRLLVVEDAPVIRELVSGFLESRGYEVVAVEGGVAALERLARERFDLAVLDILMPGMSGLELLDRLRERHSAAQVPVIMASAMDGREDLVGALARGANDYVTKPIDLELLEAKVRSHLDVRELWRRAARLEQEVADRRSELEAIVGTAPHAILTHRRGRIRMANEATARITGVPVAELAGMTLTDLVAEPAGALARYVRAAEAGVEPAATDRAFQGRIRRRDGAIRILDVRTSALPLATERGLELVNAADVTDWVELRERMARAEKNAAVEQLADRAAHEIRNNLQAPRAALEMGRKTVDFLARLLAEARAGDAAEVARAERTRRRFLDQHAEGEVGLDRVRAIVDRMQGFSFDRVQLGDHVLAALVERALPAAGNARVTIERRFDPDVGVVPCDAFQLDMVFRNLYRNAEEAMDGAGTLRVTIARAGTQVSVTFRDTGRGFSADGLARATEPGFTSKRVRVGGHGFGLYVCRTVVEAHGGRLEVANASDGGAIVTVLLPLAGPEPGGSPDGLR